MVEIYLGSVNEYITDSGISEKVPRKDITTGKVVELGSGEFGVPNLLSYTFVNSFNFNLIDGGFGYAYILKYDEMGSSATNDPNIQYWKIYKQTGNKLEILLKPLLRLNNQGAEYNNPAIESTKPVVNEVIDPLINEITIKYGIPVRLSTANISIFQLNDDLYKPSLLRQTISGDSKLCTIGSNNHTVHIPIFSSTFNQPNSSYYVVVDNNFVISQERNEPLLGIIKKTWMISTSNIHIFF
ncbi:hypothetical protein RhiirC2_801416 [Rhizophagus irregularis]|uniref:Uncharacterized protein n=1 Tax=Rhizophagus irregularis TaxID=588596 RepID=A0A2N1M2H7_9GLOM|nr:hypothetical protein RhiirC2_801416 [Rhizophagus irregularis]